jgi:hypothetical protein
LSRGINGADPLHPFKLMPKPSHAFGFNKHSVAVRGQRAVMMCTIIYSVSPADFLITASIFFPDFHASVRNKPCSKTGFSFNTWNSG